MNEPVVPGTSGAAASSAPLATAEAAPPAFATRVLRVVSGEVASLNPRLLLLGALVSLLPRLCFARLRAILYRLGGLEIGGGTLILGTLELSGSAGAAKRLHIGARCMINTPCFIELNDQVHIEDEVNIAHHVVLTTSDHVIGDSVRRAGLLTTAPIVLGKGCWIGASVTLLPGVTVGAGAIVAAGALVTRDVAPDTLVGGVPARLIKALPPGHAVRPDGERGD